MLNVRVVPCLDVRDGRVVKGVRFDNLEDQGDPARLARRYEREGADELVILDVSATAEGRVAQFETVGRVRDEISIPLTVGGGVRTAEDAGALLEAGADRVAVNTAAVERPELLSEIATRFGAQCAVLALDAGATSDDACPSGFEVLTHSGGRRTGLDAAEWGRRAAALGAGEILLTSFDRDGTRSGYDLALIGAIREAVPVPIVASGGGAHAGHMCAAVEAGADAVLAASIFHQGDWSIGRLKDRLQQLGVAVRR
ncbi:imidazole glycerol phosphate synthase subunit HisF [Candidatus Palauibacter soopunensis]|uniref:imidazole glycerol phosphate synthase subunit HisF n=1 Tax=Candidatus Palauibacter soopunensis TaxID=3056739 RepID=UPI002389AF4C|nr:imidazole glycerol phosphate synthase subunit HisF [Candidatus Palauibacter soopunensis]MDE2879020.1 imidazole glycerol phosphate synthase subunit HisF [Candidatus Palauibacter soopunensis]